MEVSRRQQINVDAGERPGFGPPNEFHHLRAFPPAEFRAVVRPNFDTLYSSAWLDLRAGPVIVHASDTDGRYYMLPMLDMWTDVIANPGKRTTGTDAQDFVVIAPPLCRRCSRRRVRDRGDDPVGVDHRSHTNEWRGRLRGG
jgi:hypothetical protein